MRILPALLCLALCSCTTLYDRKTGNPIARFMGDMTGSHYKDEGTSWDVDSVSHSAATNAIAGGVNGGIMSAGAAFMMGKAPAAITSVIRK